MSAGPSECRTLDRATAPVANVAREASLAFLEADANGDGVLDFHEFKGAIKRLRHRGGGTDLDSDAYEMRRLFDSIDFDKNGTIEMDEYFLWTLEVASAQGCGLELVFRKFDRSGEGVLDANEFALAVEELGFSATFAHDLFVDLDSDNSGAISYGELGQTIKARVGAVSETSKKLLTTLAFHDATNSRPGKAVKSEPVSIDRLNLSSWPGALVGPDVESLRVQCLALLQHSGLRGLDLFNLLSHGQKSGELPLDAFASGFKRLGYAGPAAALGALHKHIDRNGSGMVGFSEVHEWLTGKLRRAALAHEVHLLWKSMLLLIASECF